MCIRDSDRHLRAFTVSAEARGHTLMEFWIRHLCACAGGVLDGESTLDDSKRTHTLARIDPDTARTHLAKLITLHDDGMRRPLPLFAKSGFAWAKSMQDKGDEQQALKAARVAFTGYKDIPGEGGDRYIARAYPDAVSALDGEFAQLVRLVYMPLAEALAEDAR